MRGLITARHLVTNGTTIIQEFGLPAYMQCIAACLFSRRQITFLEVIMRLRHARA